MVVTTPYLLFSHYSTLDCTLLFTHWLFNVYLLCHEFESGSGANAVALSPLAEALKLFTSPLRPTGGVGLALYFLIYDILMNL